MLSFLSFAIAALGALVFLSFRTKRYLRFLQQEQYHTDRYLRWVRDRRAFDRRGSIIALIFGVLSCALGEGWGSLVCVLTAALVLAGVGKAEEDPTKVGKSRLNMTERATRIYRLALGIHLGLQIVLWLVLDLWLSLPPGTILLVQIISFRFAPQILAFANHFLLPHEKRIQAYFVQDALRVLNKIRPYIIGITGSYGKTSTKALLGEILSVCAGPTFRPPKSYNSLMGITRELRESLKPGTKYAVIEMGAFGIGSIRKLCEFTPPKAGIVTAVGLMHLERFGSEDAIFRAKSELAQAIPADGILVGNGDDPKVRRMLQENPKATTLLYGLHPERGSLDCVLEEVRPGPGGTAFVIVWKGKRYPGQTKLLGEPNLSNLCGTFSMACALGCTPEIVLAAIGNVEPVDNRLSRRRFQVEEGEVIFLDDAYNSNPTGFGAALDVLRDFPGKRKLLVTPGMIELGDKQFDENKRIAAAAGKICDVVIVVGDTNRRPFEEGLQEAKMSPEKILLVKDRTEGLDRLTGMQRGGDVILIENDLPDLYEPNTRF